MNNEQKMQVRDALLRYTEKFATQGAAAAALDGISASTISQVKNHNWELLSERLWADLARQVGFYSEEWKAADTSVHLLLRILFSDAQHFGMNYGIAIGSGLGKTFSAMLHTTENQYAYHIACNNEHNRKLLMRLILNAAGVAPGGPVPDMMQRLTTHINEKEEALLIFDDAHLLKDRALALIALLADGFNGNCGIVLLGTEQLREWVTEGVRQKKRGFEALYKCIGSRFISISNLAAHDAELVCLANNYEDAAGIAYITEQAENLNEVTQYINDMKEYKLAA